MITLNSNYFIYPQGAIKVQLKDNCQKLDI